ncbi:MAG: hypothetical protein OEX18_10735 [Candidatus Krumholzibacteria bacterium]|nr:hypothetical protein [Candidatus Krumholzibacteria bacterium]MDH4337734.1 hypothetical protein [Candidatus Krumholzibacteria bacterium]MDH5270638.1 hypothetical protein [Candidatus Krumholzibacteria bacterium]MDH5627023.1 hypothetical protein [Candidatus Krumholzibacteria bacterium]
MKRILCTVAALMVATAAFAGTASNSSMEDMTPQQAMGAMMNCPVCSVWMSDPALGPTLHHSVFATKTGYIETLYTADAAMIPAFNKCEAECQKRAEGIPGMTKEQKASLCPLCTGQMTFRGRSDVSVEEFQTDNGFIVVGSSNTPDGIKALHNYAASSKAFGEKMSQAGAEMSKEPQKAKM